MKERYLEAVAAGGIIEWRSAVARVVGVAARDHHPHHRMPRKVANVDPVPRELQLHPGLLRESAVPVEREVEEPGVELPVRMIIAGILGRMQPRCQR